MILLFLISFLANANDGTLSPDLKKQYDADLAFMAQIQGSGQTPLHQQIFGSVSGAAYKAFYNERISKVKMGNCGSNGKAIACVKLSSPSTIVLADNFVKFKHPQISRLMVLYHEARHGEWKNGNWSHEKCPVPFLNKNGQPMKSIWSGAELAGEPACDKTPFGSYGSSVILLKNISKFCKNCTEKVRQDASLYADDNFGRIVNKDAITQMTQDLYAKKK